MAQTDWKFSTSWTNEDNGGSTSTWANPGYASADDGNNAGCDCAKKDTSDYLRGVDFGFTTSDVPAGSTIDGIEVIIERYAGNTYILDSEVKLFISGGSTGDNKASGSGWPGSPATAAYGGTADTWNAGLSAADVVSTGFGIQLAIYNNAGSFSYWGYVDYIKMRLNYTTSASIQESLALSAIAAFADISLLEAINSMDLAAEAAISLQDIATLLASIGFEADGVITILPGMLVNEAIELAGIAGLDEDVIKTMTNLLTLNSMASLALDPVAVMASDVALAAVASLSWLDTTSTEVSGTNYVIVFRRKRRQ